MKTLNVSQMENLLGGTGPMATCGQAVVMGAMIGGMFSPAGALLGAIVVAGFSENCNN
ncbi:hypothetical protein [Chryseobacterium lathyri]|uniref:hypothetical protein n=1 Tax=Chryseobacterium lathyri TaxID=395933 RepID=UPI00277E3806|nr:hypothetical protein [Chryseobacterium lathyri]MDQ0065161.1 hypothetical protein [Chryseobacterium lathyri]